MLDFIKEHFKLFIAIGITIILLLVGILLLVSSNQPTIDNGTNISADGLIVDSTNQFLLKKDLTDEEKYLMLLGQNMAENYGTYELGDLRPLWDLQNQSTESFYKIVQDLIDSTNKTKNVTTKVDGNSIRLERIDSTSFLVVMNAVATDQANNTISQISSKVKLVLVGDYWLVSDIVFENQ